MPLLVPCVAQPNGQLANKALLATAEQEKEAKQEERVLLNVGGRRFEAYKITLVGGAAEGGLLSRMLSAENSALCKKDDDGCLFFDRNPDAFALLLDFLRTNQLVIPAISAVSEHTLRHEAEYFGIRLDRAQMQQENVWAKQLEKKIADEAVRIADKIAAQVNAKWSDESVLDELVFEESDDLRPLVAEDYNHSEERPPTFTQATLKLRCQLDANETLLLFRHKYMRDLVREYLSRECIHIEYSCDTQAVRSGRLNNNNNNNDSSSNNNSMQDAGANEKNLHNRSYSPYATAYRTVLLRDVSELADASEVVRAVCEPSESKGDQADG